MATPIRFKLNSPKAYIVYSFLFSLFLILIAYIAVVNPFADFSLRFKKSNEIKDIQDFSVLNQVFNSQPRISYNNDAAFLLIEIGDIDCLQCKKIHADSVDSDYNKMLKNLVETGKVDYIWLDKVTMTPLLKHSASYCAGEQGMDYFFSYKDALYKDTQFFTISRAQYIAKELKLDNEKFEGCLNSQKYEERVKKLTDMAKKTIGSNLMPEYFVYKKKEVKVRTLEGNQKDDIQLELVARFGTQDDYTYVVEPQLLKILDRGN